MPPPPNTPLVTATLNLHLAAFALICLESRQVYIFLFQPNKPWKILIDYNCVNKSLITLYCYLSEKAVIVVMHNNDLSK